MLIYQLIEVLKSVLKYTDFNTNTNHHHDELKKLKYAIHISLITLDVTYNTDKHN